jgi:hypothetical protein
LKKEIGSLKGKIIQKERNQRKYNKRKEKKTYKKQKTNQAF